MVKINAIKFIFGLFLIMVMAPSVLAVGVNVGKIVSGGQLIITDVDVKVGGKSDKNLKDGDDISEEAKPGDTVEFTIQFANNFSNDDDIDIDNIDAQVTLEEIDDGDDLDEDAKEFDLKADDDKKVKVTFKIPLEVDEDTFNVLIEADGDTDKNGSQEVKMELSLEVKKEDHEIRFLRNSVTPSEVKCGRTVQLSTGVINTGGDDEDGVVLEVSNTDLLGMSFRETFDLTNEAFDSDSKFQKTFSYNVPADTAPGSYPITSKVIFNDGRDVETETADLVVGVCDVTAKKEAKAPEEEQKTEESAVVVVKPTQTAQTTQPGTAQTVSQPVLAKPQQTSMFGSSNNFLSTLIVGEIALVIVAVIIIFAVMRRRA